VASAQGIRAGRAFVELFADDSKLVRGLRRAEKKLKAFGDSIRNLGLKMIGVGSAILAPLAASAKLFGSYGDSVAKMARRTGLAVERPSANCSSPPGRAAWKCPNWRTACGGCSGRFTTPVVA